MSGLAALLAGKKDAGIALPEGEAEGLAEERAAGSKKVG